MSAFFLKRSTAWESGQEIPILLARYGKGVNCALFSHLATTWNAVYSMRPTPTKKHTACPLPNTPIGPPHSRRRHPGHLQVRALRRRSDKGCLEYRHCTLPGRALGWRFRWGNGRKGRPHRGRYSLPGVPDTYRGTELGGAIWSIPTIVCLSTMPVDTSCCSYCKLLRKTAASNARGGRTHGTVFSGTADGPSSGKCPSRLWQV